MAPNVWAAHGGEAASGATAAAAANEEQPRTTETTQYIVEKPSQSSMASATIVATRTTEKSGRLSTGSAADVPRASDVSSPNSAQPSPFETDIEAMIPQSSNQTNPNRRSVPCRGLGGDTQVWPGQSHWKRKAKEQKMKRSCTCLSRLGKKSRLVVKILIGILIVGIAVGVGVGISKPLGAGIWKPSSS
ncbi:hypothetical protein SPI_06206 [Niveomyces insectorum RCEF 264]|uniref:Uncharacterized protein n=1 Tax=Niveomyces insectorum RCEF 264 TaxID=1081102 RepID=A0A167RWC6_9HYPO|nr:hypothetical protein SPI_06206 [Niveomyces insectorum RCEF 264]